MLETVNQLVARVLLQEVQHIGDRESGQQKDHRRNDVLQIKSTGLFLGDKFLGHFNVLAQVSSIAVLLLFVLFAFLLTISVGPIRLVVSTVVVCGEGANQPDHCGEQEKQPKSGH